MFGLAYKKICVLLSQLDFLHAKVSAHPLGSPNTRLAWLGDFFSSPTEAEKILGNYVPSLLALNAELTQAGLDDSYHSQCAKYPQLVGEGVCKTKL